MTCHPARGFLLESSEQRAPSEPARRVYELFAHAHNPPPYRAGVLYYRFRIGDVALFVLDVRSHRSPPVQPDRPGKTMPVRSRNRCDQS